MHIPDGYLGPVTFITLFLVMFVFWYFAFKNANKYLGPRNVPVLSFMAALSFMLMMFNLPIPDGTSGHMVGAVLIAIVLGPYGATIALSIALLIQALLFGDGGVTAYGANVFNMGVVMPFTGILVYIAARKALNRTRLGKTTKARGIAAFLGGYVGIVLAALSTSIMIGIQPSIAPGYAPYGLDIAVPAMVISHLFVGIIEGLTTAIVIMYLSENRPDLLRLPKLAPRWMEGSLQEDLPSGPRGKARKEKVPAQAKGSGMSVAKLDHRPFPKKWLFFLVLAIISPIGILLTWGSGGAWGEWDHVGDWTPQHFWNAPLGDYNIGGWDGQLMGSMGYMLSAIVGVVAIIIVIYLLCNAVAKRSKKKSER